MDCNRFLLSPSASAWQTPAQTAALPDIAALSHRVEQHQAEVDRLRDQYTCRQEQRVVIYDKAGKIRKTEQRTSNVFFVHGRPIETLLSKDGKPLSDAEIRKQQEGATKEAVKLAAEPSQQPQDRDQITVSRLLVITRMSNPRRLVEDGRSIIAVDFVGDPHAKTQGRGENTIKHVRGTVWIDEQASEISRLEATVDDPLRLGFGILASVNPGSHFEFQQAFVRNETWLPTSFTGRFDGRAALLVGFHIEVSARFDQYQKFQAAVTQQTTEGRSAGPHRPPG